MEKERNKPKVKTRNQDLGAPPQPLRRSDFDLLEPATRTSEQKLAKDLYDSRHRLTLSEGKKQEESLDCVKTSTDALGDVAQPAEKSVETTDESDQSKEISDANDELHVCSKQCLGKARESTRTSGIIELPLDALIPRSNSREEPRAPLVYPDLVQLAESTHLICLPPSNPQIQFRSKNLYPIMSHYVEDPVNCETAMMSETQLAAYYQNDLLGIIDDYVDQFVEEAIRPQNSLFCLLQKFKTVCESLERCGEVKSQLGIQLTRTNNEVWSVQDHKAIHTGRCGDNRSAQGEVYYKKANFKMEKLVQLKDELHDLTRLELNESFCEEVCVRSLTLQIQWIILALNKNFMTIQNVDVHAFPSMVSGQTQHDPSRTELRGALSDLFYFLRFPILPQRFRDQVTRWIVEVSAVLLKSVTPQDQQFLLCHLLRVPSPIRRWGIQLVQTFISVPSLEPNRVVDGFLALLSLVMHSVKQRDQFLVHVYRFYEADSEWNVISDDGDTENTNLLDLSEQDLVAIISQFSMGGLFSVAVKHFTCIHQNNHGKIMMSVISFGLILLKLFDEGLKSHASLKTVCKKIADYIKKTVSFICSYFTFIKDDIPLSESILLRNEVSRLTVVAVSNIVNKKSNGMWQYIADFPYEVVTECCRLRILLLLSDIEVTSTQVLEIPNEMLEKYVKSKKTLDNLDKLSEEDATFAITSISTVISKCELDVSFFVNELIEVCFLEEHTRVLFYKAGSEAVSLLLERKPELLSLILHYIDRRIDHLDRYAVDILTNAPLLHCKLTEDEIGSLLGKWLVNRPVDHPVSLIARRVLSSLNWGSDPMYLDVALHEICAETVVKAHAVQCKSRNNLISKSFQKAAKMALRCPDLEQQFDRFCWDVLLKLKPLTNKPISDLTAFFVFIRQHALATTDVFLESGLNYWVELVNAGCFNAAVTIAAQIIEMFPTRIHLLTASATFCKAFDRLIHADESSYAVQLVMGVDKFPGQVLKLFASAVANHLSCCREVSDFKGSIHAWLQVMTCQKSVVWNQDNVVLYVLDVLCRFAFLRDPGDYFYLNEHFSQLYRSLFNTWTDTPKGVMSWFSTQLPPVTVASDKFSIAPWLSYMLLMVEPSVFTALYAELLKNMGKHVSRSLEECVKRAQQKSHIMISVDRLAFYRWLEFCTRDDLVHHAVYPLALQQLCIVMFQRHTHENTKFCPGERYLCSQTAERLWQHLRGNLLPSAEKEALNENVSLFFRCVSQWLFCPQIYKCDFSNFNDLPMDYLVQMIIAGDSHPWVEFVNVPELKKANVEQARVFGHVCQPSASSQNVSSLAPPVLSLSSFFQNLSIYDSGSPEPFPLVPEHKNMAANDNTTKKDLTNSQMTLVKFQTDMDKLVSVARAFVDCKDQVDKLNGEYVTQFQKLYVNRQTTLGLQLKCGNVLSSRCQRPGTSNVVVEASHYDDAVALRMNKNRQEREKNIAELLKLTDPTAVKCARIENLCWLLLHYSKMASFPVSFSQHVCNRSSETTLLQQTGLHCFYRMCNHVQSDHLLFPALTMTVENCCETLGKAFVFENPAEQFNILRLVLSGNLLNTHITPHFSPHCVGALELVRIYNELSAAVRSPTTAEYGLMLLERLDIVKTGNFLPPAEFSSLMPVIFENLSSVTYGTPLHKLCLQHFETAMYHQYPHNVAKGFRLLLSGIDSRCVPKEHLTIVAQKFQISHFLHHMQFSYTKPAISVDLAKECLLAIADQLRKSRHELNTKLFTVWADHLDQVCLFAEFFIKVVVCSQFQSQHGPSQMEKELRNTFLIVQSVWSNLMEPVGDSRLAPWSPCDGQLAEKSVVQRFVQLLMWLPHSTYLPPGSETLETLVWQYFAQNLSQLQRAGTSHVFAVYEQKFVGFNWTKFWPNLLDLSAFEVLLTEGPSDVAPLITDILVRIPWPQIILAQQNQPVEAERAFHSLLLVIFSRCSYKEQNYAKARASVEKLLGDWLSYGKWSYVKQETVEKVASFIGSSFPAESVTNPNSIISAFFGIWREVCHFTTTRNIDATNHPDYAPEVVARKQAQHIHAELRLMNRSLIPVDDQCRHYRSLLNKSHLIVSSSLELEKQEPIATELITFWPQVAKAKKLDALFDSLIGWMNDKPDSPVVLLMLRVAVTTLSNYSPPLGFKLLDRSIQAYFKRRTTCTWAEVCEWVRIPRSLTQWLYMTPSLEPGNEPRFLALNAHVQGEISVFNHAQNTELLKGLAAYLSSLKPKHVTFEAGFFICLEKWVSLVVSQYTNGVAVTVANTQLDCLIEFLRKICLEEKGVSLFNMRAFFGKKVAYSARTQLLASLLRLFLQQQQNGPSQGPRLEHTQMVLNSQLSAFNEIARIIPKQCTDIPNVDEVVSRTRQFFTQPEKFNLHNASKLLVIVAQHTLPEDSKIFESIET